MKLTKKQYRKIEHLMPIPRKPPEIKLSIFVCITLHDRKRLQMEGTAKEIWKVAHNLWVSLKTPEQKI